MGNKIEQLGGATQQLIRTTEALKTIVMGDHEVIKQLEEFPTIIKKMQDEQKTNATGTTNGDQGPTDSSLELK